MKERICKNCKFFHVRGEEQPFPDHEEKETQCRRYAPRMLSGCGTGFSWLKFPFVKESDWCGEFMEAK